MSEDISFRGLEAGGSSLASSEASVFTPPRLPSPYQASVTPSPCTASDRRSRAPSGSPLVQLPSGALSSLSCMRSDQCAPSPGEDRRAGEPASPGEARAEDSSPGEIAHGGSCSSSGTDRAAEVARLRAAADAAMLVGFEEIAALRAENSTLRASQQFASEEVVRLRRKLAAHQEEICSLRSLLDTKRQRARQTQACSGYGDENAVPVTAPNSSLAQDQLAHQLAVMEIGALSACAEEERQRLRRQLQLKWHPDKNAHNAAFATRVLQEMQRRPEWQ
eukprot:CAMPEP_0197664172 /NCGR_PEP_ID=MMETSP1338-20131121/58473_1 /TAXON_ID=43686 ORGANISM="Pelagodinium beii, Strain RCC1491" /NCGR_SAMPLE_ID=MMETSP1338 /ASSEMBLY_ACC=CAM_ASM_000754 /LENGTH=276 /DNA_ID=CAMNT_0043242753 /DNA_START=56 /DNA_END=886 /DNA_ORIENTATION=+